MKFKILVSLTLLFMLTSCNLAVVQEDITEDDNTYFEDTYNLDFSDEKVSFILLNYDEFIAKNELEGNFIVVATRDDCGYCHKIMPKYISVMAELDISKIYFINTRSLTQEQKENLRDEHSIEVVPTTIVYSGEGSKEVIIGDTDESALKAEFSKIK